MVMGDAYSNDLGVHASAEDRERAIEAFAAELLLPARAIADAWSRESVARDQLVGFAARYRVSWSLAIAQAERAGVVKAGARSSLMARTPTRAEFLDALGWVPTPDLLAVRVAPDYATAVFNAFKMRKLTRTRAVEMLHGEITPEDLPLEDALDTQDG